MSRVLDGVFVDEFCGRFGLYRFSSESTRLFSDGYMDLYLAEMSLAFQVIQENLSDCNKKSD